MAAGFFGDLGNIVTKASTIVQSAADSVSLYLEHNVNDDGEQSYNKLYYIITGPPGGKQLKFNDQFSCPWVASTGLDRCEMNIPKSTFLEAPRVITKLGTAEKCSIPSCAHGWKIYYEMVANRSKTSYPNKIWCEIEDINALLTNDWVIGNNVKYVAVLDYGLSSVNIIKPEKKEKVTESVPSESVSRRESVSKSESVSKRISEDCLSSLEQEMPAEKIADTRVYDKDTLDVLFNTFKYEGAALKSFQQILEDIVSNRDKILGPLYPAVSQQLKAEMDKLTPKESIMEKKFYNKCLRLFHPDKYCNKPVEDKAIAQRMYDIVEESYESSKTPILQL